MPETKRGGIRFAQRAQRSIALWLILGSMALPILGGAADKMASARAETVIAGTKQEGSRNVRVFEAGPLGQPKSLQQTGVPLDTTRAAIPPDNPQTPEKIALGQRLFFEPRLSAEWDCRLQHLP
jgi:cytochrome c peroxidase